MFKEYAKDPMYLVNEKGDVLSKFTGKLLKPSKSARGYLVVNTRREDGVRSPTNIHRMVAETFLPRVEGKDHINHIDADKTNNRVSNLEWCTDAENKAHACSHKLHLRGEDHSNSVLSEDMVREICCRISLGESYGEIAKAMPFELTRGTFLNIRARRTWKHVSDEYEWPKRNTANKLSGRATTIPKGSTPK